MKRFVSLTSIIFVFAAFMNTTVLAKTVSKKDTKRVCVTTMISKGTPAAQKCRNLRIHKMHKGTKVPKRGNR